MNKETKRNYDKRYRTTPRARACRLFNSAKRRRQEGLDITPEWIQKKLETGRCEITGLPFVLDRWGKGPWSPSLDRTDNDKGYAFDNVKVVVWCYNAAKGEATSADVLRLAEALCIHEKR